MSCATAGEADDDGPGVTADATVQGPDAPSNPFADARTSFPDASLPVDAPLNPIIDASPPPIDAPPVGTPDAAPGGFCGTNADCVASECCWVVACVPGTQTGLDPPLNCVPE